MIQIPQEAIDAACTVTVLGEDENNKPVHLGPREARIALEAALPFLSPIAGEGKVKALEWRSLYPESTKWPKIWRGKGVMNALYACEQYGPDYGWVGMGGSFPTLDEAKAAAQDHYQTQILSALISSPGKDGGQEVEAVKPSIDTMREAAWALIKKNGWGAPARLSLHQVTGLMAQLGMNVSRGEVGCGYPDCGCCADAACEDAIKQHADFSSPQSTVDADAVIERCIAEVNAVAGTYLPGGPSDIKGILRGVADRIRALKAKSPSSDRAASEVTPHSFAQEYEFRGDTDYTPTDGERTMIEDAICGYLAEAKGSGQ